MPEEPTERRSDALLPMVANLPTGAVYVDGNKLYPNQAAVDIIGHPRTAVATLDHWFRRLYGERAADVRAYYEKDRDRDFPEPRTVMLTRQDGTDRMVEFAAYRYERGEVWLLYDVTERALAREAQRQAMARTQAVVESAVDGIVTIDATGVIESINPAAEVMFGYAAEEIVGRNVNVLMPSPYHEEHDDYLRHYLKTGRRRMIGIGREAVGRRKGGATFPVDLAVSEFFHPGGRSFVGTLRDLTERKQIERNQRLLEEQFRQAQKMEAVGRLAGGVAHDFNTLLGMITGYSEMLLDGLDDGHPLRRAAEQIYRGAERGASLTRQLLAFSRQQVLRLEVQDLDDVLTEMDDMLRRLVGDDVELVFDLDRGAGHVRVDAGQVGQVMMNLVVNACDAMPRGGRIRVRTYASELEATAAEKLGAGAAGRFAVLELSDSGSGMDAETRQRLFEPFFTTKAVGKGTGLGLSTVFGIVRQSGGGIAVDSRLGHGTTFRIYLPQVEGSEKRAVAPPAPSSSTRGRETVLLAEDDEMFRGLLVEVLEAKGYSVLAAPEPAAALEACERHEGAVDLLVSDMVMPGGMTGNELARRLLERYPSMKVILMSGYTDEDLAERGVSRQDGVFLQKPFSTKVFLHTVRSQLDG